MILIYIVIIWMLAQMSAPIWTYALIVIGAILRVVLIERDRRAKE